MRIRTLISRANIFGPTASITKETAAAVIDITDKIGAECKEKYGNRLVYAADEFYLKAERSMPHYSEYGDFPQLDNGVGMWALFQKESEEAFCDLVSPETERRISCVTGVAAYPLIKSTVDKAEDKWHNLKCNVYPIKNNFFGEQITVSGLLTGKDISEQLQDKKLGDVLFFPSNALRADGDLFLDDMSPDVLSEKLGVTVSPARDSGEGFICDVLGVEHSI
jgi:NifB/MoaA-like Fe-S oxidoreductase